MMTWKALLGGGQMRQELFSMRNEQNTGLFYTMFVFLLEME